MSERDTENVEIEESEETKNVLVVDPDDYRKTQKLKAINESKKRFKEINQNHTELYRELKETWSNPKEALRRKRANALAVYGSELLPLIEEGLDTGALSEDDLIATLGENKVDMEIRKIVRQEGEVHIRGEKEPLPRANCMEVYRQLERIERKLGLGLDLEEDKGPANI
jgi:sugar phosphate isomerase/epimerase